MYINLYKQNLIKPNTLEPANFNTSEFVHSVIKNG